MEEFKDGEFVYYNNVTYKETFVIYNKKYCPIKYKKMITTILIILLICFYIITGVCIYAVASFTGVKFDNLKNILLITFYPIGMWFLN